MAPDGGPTTAASASASAPVAPCGTVPPVALDSSSRASLRVVRADFVSRGHTDDEWTATVRVGEPSPAEPSCTVWLEEQRHGNGPVEAVLGIEQQKQGAEPWFLVASPEGTLLRRGPLSDCSGCHAATPGGVFSAAFDESEATPTPAR